MLAIGIASSIPNRPATWAPINRAITVVTGLVASTILTLIVIPTVYCIVSPDRKRPNEGVAA